MTGADLTLLSSRIVFLFCFNTGLGFKESNRGKVKVRSLHRVRLFVTPWTATYQAPLSMEFSRQEYWSGVPLPSPIYIWVTCIEWFWFHTSVVFESILHLFSGRRDRIKWIQWHWQLQCHPSQSRAFLRYYSILLSFPFQWVNLSLDTIFCAMWLEVKWLTGNVFLGLCSNHSLSSVISWPLKCLIFTFKIYWYTQWYRCVLKTLC